jgi:hypothetical protein
MPNHGDSPRLRQLLWFIARMAVFIGAWIGFVWISGWAIMRYDHDINGAYWSAFLLAGLPYVFLVWFTADIIFLLKKTSIYASWKLLIVILFINILLSPLWSGGIAWLHKNHLLITPMFL